MTDHSQKNEPKRKRAGFFEEDNGDISSFAIVEFYRFDSSCFLQSKHLSSYHTATIL
jgi:hypothetical protein